MAQTNWYTQPEIEDWLRRVEQRDVDAEWLTLHLNLAYHKGFGHGRLSIEYQVDQLRAEIGSPPEGSHPHEAKPRGETWHAERANWTSEVEQLRQRVAELEQVVSGLDYDGSKRCGF